MILLEKKNCFMVETIFYFVLYTRFYIHDLFDVMISSMSAGSKVVREPKKDQNVTSMIWGYIPVQRSRENAAEE